MAGADDEYISRLLLGDVSLGTRHTPPPPRDEYLDRVERTYHLYMIGKSGAGKTSLLRNLIHQDMLAGHGLAVLAPDDEMFRDFLLPSIPEHRISDVIYVDPADTERPIPLNPLHLSPGERLHEKVDETRRAMLRMVEGDDPTAHRMRTILRHTVHTLIECPGHTLLDIPRLLRRDDAGERMRKDLASRVSDEVTREFWRSDYPRMEKNADQPVLNRLGDLLSPPVRTLLCTPGACLDFRQAMDSHKILLFRLTSGALQGSGNAGIVGQLIVGKLKLAALSREDIPEPERQRDIDRYFFPIFIDEFQTFCGTDLKDWQEMLQRHRKYLAPLHIAHLQTDDLPESLIRHILGIVSTFVFFQMGYFDARRVSHELTYRDEDGELQYLAPAHLVSLPKHHAYAKVRGELMRLKMLRPPEHTSPDVAHQVVHSSRNRYGVPAQVLNEPGSAPLAQQADQLPLAEVDPGDPFA